MIRHSAIVSLVAILTAGGVRAQYPQWKIYKPTNTGTQGNYSFAVARGPDGNLWANGHDPIWDEGGLVMYDGRVWHNWSTVDSAAPDEELSSIKFDAQGNLWCASKVGLLRFDGTEWTAYNKLVDPRFPTDTVTDVDIDSDGNIWFTLAMVNYNVGGIGRFDGDSFTFWTRDNGLPFPEPWNQVGCIAAGPDGTAYAGSEVVGVAMFDGDTWTYLGTQAGGWMGDIVVDSTGLAWFAAATGGLTSFDGSNWVYHGSPSSGVLGLALRAAGGLWIASPAGVHTYDGSWTDLNWPGGHAYTIAEWPDGSIWAGGIGGVANRVQGAWTLYNVANVSMTGRWVNGVDFDSQGNVWMGVGGGGICRFDGETWRGYNPYNRGMYPWPYGTDNVNAAVEDTAGNIWVATYGQGIVVWDGQNWVRQYMQYGVIDDIIRDSIAGLWAQAGSGLYHFEADTWRRFDWSNSPLPGYVYGIGADAGGFVWAATLGGLVRTDGTLWEVYTPQNSRMPGSGRCYSPSRAPDGSVWMAAALNENWTASGILRFRREDTTWTVFDSTNAPIHHTVLNVAVTPSGTAWVGFFRGGQVPYRGGVARHNGEEWVLYNTENSPLPHEQIYNIGIDPDENPWISCASEGVAVIYDHPVAADEGRRPRVQVGGLQVFPNPFRGSTTIRLETPEAGTGTLTIVDPAGRVVERFDRVLAGSGRAELRWNAAGLPKGVYFVNARLGSFSGTVRVVLAD